ncbi:chaperone DnaJ-domain superfamily protein [Tasmannia lanceolata]|uniref:chaperone DnaJ-domain superfamily protein n=1 Tax=Tasmannia lanceolata TaxID=3420 RepID=UPI0040645678
MAFQLGEIPLLLFYFSSSGNLICRNRFSTESKTITDEEFSGKNAYDVLEVSETSTFSEIKASFRKLAKETHPDTAPSHTHTKASYRFIQILAAYEILSDSEKRAHYDQYLFSQRKKVEKHHRQGSTMYRYESCVTTKNQMEVVEWLKWYRLAINDVLTEKKVMAGSTYLDILENEFYAAIHMAYYGPVIESMDLLPDCFEAEERSSYETPEVLHLVSGRDLFGIVCLIDKVPELSDVRLENLTPLVSEMCQFVKHTNISGSCGVKENTDFQRVQVSHHEDHISDVYKGLELHISGRVVAVATRTPPKSSHNGLQNHDSEDHIHVFLSLDEDQMSSRKAFSSRSPSFNSVGSSLLGTITGLGTNSEEGPCFVYNNSGTKTHMIMKHRTLLVKHLHWYQVGDEVSTCECRCNRARLPPSKFWLFEPRCGLHDIGGWYVETFGRDKKGKTVPSQREWDGFNATEHLEKRLHPAMYLMALAYKTLDLEEAKRRKTVTDIVGPKLFSILRWCKKLV